MLNKLLFLNLDLLNTSYMAMELSHIIEIIRKGEGPGVEFKKVSDTVPSSFYETVVSFSNCDGGIMLLGVEDSGAICGINPGASGKLQKEIITALNSRDCINPPVYIQPFTIEHPDGLVMVIQIPSSSQIHTHRGIIFSREFESDINVTNNHQKISDLYLRKRNFFTEAQIYPHLSINDLDPELFAKARQIIRNYKSDHPWLLVSEEQMLRDSVLWRKDFQTGEEGLTLAAALIFGKDPTIQSILPGYKVEAMVRIKNVDRWDDRINPPLRTNLIDTYLILKDFIDKYLPEKFYSEMDQRIDLRDKIFREVIGNVIVHREYTSALSTELIITEKEVRFTNPNKPVFHGVIDPRGFNPYPKNPNIRKFFTAFGWTDEIGSGIRNTNKYLPLYVPGAYPVFIENDIFTTQIPLVFITMAKFGAEFVKWLQLPDFINSHLMLGLSRISLPADLSDAGWDDLLLYLVPSWHQKGIQLNTLTWPDIQLHKKDEIKKVPGWNLKSTQLLRKKVRYLIAILSLCPEPVKMSVLLNSFDYKNEKAFRENYIKPLRTCGLIAMTIPDRPTDSNNKYVTTETGKLFLSGK